MRKFREAQYLIWGTKSHPADQNKSIACTPSLTKRPSQAMNEINHNACLLACFLSHSYHGSFHSTRFRTIIVLQLAVTFASNLHVILSREGLPRHVQHACRLCCIFSLS